MRVFKKVQRNYEDTILDRMVCDVISCDNFTTRVDLSWSKDLYRINTVHIKNTTGYDYPEDPDMGEPLGYDICPDCWQKYVVPFMKNLTGRNPSKVSF